MRSIHKKTLKRFLSTLLALTMVLGMVPFTASAAAPATVTLEQSGLKATITPSVPAVTAGNTSTVTYAVTIEATAATANGKNVSLTIGPPEHYMSYAFGAVTITGSAITGTVGMPAGLALSGNKITGTVTGGGYAIGSHTVPMSLTVSDLGTDTDSTTFTVDQKAALTVTATPNPVKAGEDFTVTATSDIADGRVLFEYNGESKYVDVESRLNGSTTIGYAECTFAAADSVTNVKATQFDMTGVVNTEATDTITVNAATVYHTITFDGNAVDAYHIPDPVSVEHGSAYNGSAPGPDRTGYTFAGWATTSDAATPNVTGTTPLTVDTDKTLYAVWKMEQVHIDYPDTWPTGVTSAAVDTDVDKGSTVTFKVTVDPTYDVSTMVVTAGGVALAPVATGNANEYQFSFVANADTTVSVSAPQEIPVYHTITFLPGAVDAYIPFSPTTVSVKQGDSYTLPAAIPTREGYTFKGWDSDDSNTVIEYPYDGIAYTTSTVTPTTADMTLNAVWEVEKVAVTLATGTPPTGVTLNSSPAGMKDKGSTVYFTLTVAAGYDPSTLVVTANGVALAAVKSATSSNMYLYSFVADAATEVAVSAPSKLTYTVMMPVGHFTAKLTMANGVAVAAPGASASINHGSGYTFTVKPASGYEIKGVYVNGAVQTADSTGADGTQTFIVTDVTSAQTVEVLVDEIPSYTVTFTVPLTGQTFTQTVTRGGKATEPVVKPEREGYTFGGWFEGSNYSVGTTQFNFTTPITADTILYGKLTPATYTITYNLNGASGTAPTAQNKTHGLAITLRPDTPTWTGHTFLGWSTNQKAETPTYQPGDAYSGDANITLYAVWKIDTFTVTLPNGTGYTAMPATGSSSPVDYNGSFTFTVTVDPEYAVTKPTVKVGNTDVTNSLSGSNPYTYTINNITADQVVSVSVTKNSVYTVTFMVNGSVYQTQQVEHGAKATVPNPPSVEGYTFGGWYKSTDFIDANKFDFTAGIIVSTTVYAKMTAITPEVTWDAPAANAGWTFDVTSADVTVPASDDIDVSPNTVKYGSKMEFNVVVKKGYDATNLAVAANGLALNPVLVTENGDGTTTYSFILSNITADQKITVTGVARKMITITYNDNGGIGGPGQEQVKYYLSDTDCGEISTVKPTRVGYEFLGWATTNNAAAPAYSNPAKTTAVDGYDTSKIANFTTDTTLYAVWSAKTTTVTLEVSNTTLTNAEYEGENVTLTATVTSGSDAVTSGSVQFYRANNSSAAELVGTAKVSGGKAVLSIATSAYKRGEANTDSYTVKFIPDEGSGYSKADTTAAPDVVTVLSTAISWKLNASSQVDTKANELTIKDSNGATVTSMTAGQEYTLELPKIYALDDQATALVVNKDYKVTWQFCNASGTWEDYTAAAGTNSVKILAEYSQYVFRAVVTPLTGATGHFTQAAKYNAATTTTPATLIANQYEAYLVTEATSPVAQQATATSLAVTDTHDLTDGTVAEFEGQEVTLTATVTLTGSSTTKVTTGEVYFYKAYNYTSNTGTLIGKANVQSDGTAVLEAEMSTYVAGTSDVFTAVYQSNPTYATSVSSKTVGGDKVGESVLIRSTAIAWAKDTSGAEVKTLTVTPTGDIYADNQYTLTLPAIKEEGQDVTLTVGTDYVVSWYMVKADKTVVLLAENTESNTYTVVPPTAGVTYYAVVSPKAGSNYTDAYEDSTTKNFLTSEKTAASVQSPTITTITFGEVLTDTGKTPDFSQYEEKTITITAKVVEADLTTPANAKDPEEVVKSGTVTFYVVTKSDGTYEKIGTATVSNGLATVSYTLPEFALNDGLSNIEYFFAVYSDTAGTYADSNTTEDGTVGTTVAYTNVNADTEAVQILSTTISWKIDSTNKIVADPDANKLKVYIADANGNKGALVTDGKMTAGSSYVLELPAVYALDDAKNATPTALTVNKDYIVVWQYREFGASEWQGYPNGLSSDTALITPTYSGYQFQAIVTPIYDNEHLTGYKTAAAYDSSDVATGKTSFLVTDPTEKTELQKTTTTLAITGADKEVKNTVINGTATFTKDHWAQYEGQTVTLTATVKETSTGTPDVESGVVRFYRYVDGTNDAFLGEVALDTNGNAILENVTISAYDTAKAVTENRDLFYAVYVGTATYQTSTSTSDVSVNEGYRFAVSGKYYERVFIKSTAIQTPVIDAKRGTTDEGSTTYTADLTELLAGVEHTFTLKTTGATTTESANWSVVALDGRTVVSTDYTIQWLVTTGTNEEKAANNETAATFVVNESKSGDKYRVKLVPTADGDMKTGATSNYVVIGTKQDVTVTVTASDEITSTEVDRANGKYPDVYQLNEITLTAEVQGKESQIMPPTGNVTFYYSVDNTNWVEIGTAALALDEVSGTKKATIVTDKLPVDVDNGYKQEQVTVTAVYAGDETFQKSGEFNTTTKEITDTVAGAVTDETVTVYSSVVFVSETDENCAVTSTALTTDGIHIVPTGDLKANETGVVLTLQDIYTLDHPINLSKLVYGKDYTVEWQILENASQYNESGNYGKTVNWADTGVTLKNYTISSVPQDAAYRAKITVTDTAPVQGSARGVLQGAENATTTGRQVYYSNVLVVGAGQATVTTNITTSDNTKFNEEGIVAGETVTIHALVAGAAKVTPISKLTATIVPQGVTDPALAVFTDEKDNVNGYNAFTWDTTNVTPGYYTLTVVATSNNGYAPQKIERTLIVRDNIYKLEATKESKVYNGKAQGIDWSLTGVGIENDLAQKSVVVYYYTTDAAGNKHMVEPTQVGTYNYELYLPASAYWTELTHVTGEFTITPRPVNVVDLVAQAKVYDGTTNVNIQEIILNDAVTDQGTTGLPTGTTGVINGDSVYATVENLNVKLNSENAGANAIEFTIKSDVLKGDDAGNYKLVADTYTGEAINVQRSQVKGDIADSTFQYTGSNITVPADDIYLIDQAGNVLTPADYTVTYYYHNGDGVEKVDAMNKLGKYTVIARPEQDNYKGGASQVVYVVSDNAVDKDPDTTAKSALIDITNTVKLFDGTATGVTVTATKGTATASYYYNNGTTTDWHTTAPTAAGRYLVKVTASTGDTAYGIYTIVKANPVLTLSAADMVYDSGRYDGTLTLNGTPAGAEVYYTYTGGTIQGIAYEAPTEIGSYVVTAHIGETDNYTAHEVSANFAITKKALTITADSLQRWQYGSYPDMIAKFEGLATEGVAPDTSLRDVQIQPEFIFNDLNGDGQPEYTNSALDQVGVNYPITVRNALARNYEVSYVEGNYSVTEEEPKADLAIHGMIDNGTAVENIAYYGDKIQLYAYGYYKSNPANDGTGVYNPSSLLKWEVDNAGIASITQDGLLTITGVGTFNVILTRGSGTAAISTSIEIEAKKQEVKVIIPEENKVYSGAEQTYTTANGYAVNGKLANVSSDFNYSNTKRTDVGSQIVTGKVLASDLYYQSETYGGLFTINDKEVTVKPNAQTVTYGDALSIAENAYTVEGEVGSAKALTGNTNVASVRELYNNLDVFDGYEILVTGTENINYNVKYETKDNTNAATIGDVKVNALALDVSTGTLDANVGMTSGSLNPNGKFPVNGAEVNASATLGASNVRMYGEPNWVMDFNVWTDPNKLITGDSLADLATLPEWLVKFDYTKLHNIAEDANLEYPTPQNLMTGKSNYSIDSSMSFGNYTVSKDNGTQNIYQRPVTLKLSNSQTALNIYFAEILTSGGAIDTAKLLNIIINNVEAGKYNDGTNEVGGLAELLKHTVTNLDLQVTTDFAVGATTFTATVTVGNPNYWLGNPGQKFDITVNILPQRLTVDYTTFTATFSDVILYKQTEATRTPAYATGEVTFKIYRYVDGKENYSYYAANEATVFSGTMTKDMSRTGRYYVTYPKLSAGTYRVFAVASGYTIID